MKAIREHHRLCLAKSECSRYATLLLFVAIVAFLLGMIFGGGSETSDHDSRIEWPKPPPRSLLP